MSLKIFGHWSTLVVYRTCRIVINPHTFLFWRRKKTSLINWSIREQTEFSIFNKFYSVTPPYYNITIIILIKFRAAVGWWASRKLFTAFETLIAVSWRIAWCTLPIFTSNYAGWDCCVAWHLLYFQKINYN